MSLACDAPAKLNLCLYLGEKRDDGLHDLMSLFDSISLCDRLTLDTHRTELEGGDLVVCPGVEGENLAERALRRCRELGLLEGPPVTLEIEKRIPVAAGLGGGSADAAAALRLVAAIYNRGLGEFDELAFELGADVPSQLRPGATLVQGAGERLVPVDPRCMAAAARTYVIVAQREGLSTTALFAEADRLGLPRAGLDELAASLVDALSRGTDFDSLCAQIHNDFTPAILALRPELATLLDELREAGAGAAAFTGSGPTCFGVFDDESKAAAAVGRLRARGHDASQSRPVDREVAVPRQVKVARHRGGVS